jgi:hypothetical protein
MTPSDPVFLNKMAAILLLVFSVFGLLFVGIAFIFFHYSFQLSQFILLDALDFFLSILRAVLSPDFFVIYSFLSLGGIFTGVLLLRRKRIGQVFFIGINILFIIDSLYSYTIIYLSFRDFLISLFQQKEILSVIHRTGMTLFISGIILVAIHSWMIWRYMQPDMKEVFY